MLVIENQNISAKFALNNYKKILADIRNDEYSFSIESSDSFLNSVLSVKNVIKDIIPGIAMKIESINSDYVDTNSRYIQVNFENGLTGFINAKQEIKFLEKIFNIEITTTEQLNNLFQSSSIYAIQKGLEETDDAICSIREGWDDSKRKEFANQIRGVEPEKVYSAIIHSRNAGGYFCTIDGVNVYMPGSLAAANKITNFDTLLNTTIPVMLENYLPQTKMYIVSNKKYIQNILPIRAEAIKIGNSYEGKVTGITDYAIFVEFDEIFTGMLHISELDPVTQKRHATDDIKDGDFINFFIKSINTLRGTIKFTLTQKTAQETDNDILKIKQGYEMFKEQSEGSIQTGEIVFLKNDYAFVNFQKSSGFNVRGLLSSNEIAEYNKNGISIERGKMIEVYVSRVSPEESKIYLKYPLYS
jgi:predicted RNA-binding protein with RPS1 domain